MSYLGKLPSNAVLGNSSGSVDITKSIVVTSGSNFVLRESGGTLGMGLITSSSISGSSIAFSNLATVVKTGFDPVGYRTTSADITIDSDDCMVLVDTSGAARNITLPAASQGRQFVLKKKTTDANKITLVRAASESIEGTAANYDLPGSTFANRVSWLVWCDGTDWWVS